jgi:hypothetical protein
MKCDTTAQTHLSYRVILIPIQSFNFRDFIALRPVLIVNVLCFNVVTAVSSKTLTNHRLSHNQLDINVYSICDESNL